jgi:hypothetical protein
MTKMFIRWYTTSNAEIIPNHYSQPTPILSNDAWNSQWIHRGERAYSCLLATSHPESWSTRNYPRETQVGTEPIDKVHSASRCISNNRTIRRGILPLLNPHYTVQ